MEILKCQDITKSNAFTFRIIAWLDFSKENTFIAEQSWAQKGTSDLGCHCRDIQTDHGFLGLLGKNVEAST